VILEVDCYDIGDEIYAVYKEVKVENVPCLCSLFDYYQENVCPVCKGVYSTPRLKLAYVMSGPHKITAVNIRKTKDSTEVSYVLDSKPGDGVGIVSDRPKYFKERELAEGYAKEMTIKECTPYKPFK
jgi:hypothetical protein